MQKALGMILVGLLLLPVVIGGGLFLIHASAMNGSAMMMHGQSGHHDMMGSMHQWMHGASSEPSAESTDRAKSTPTATETDGVQKVFVVETAHEDGLAFRKQGSNNPSTPSVNPTLRVERGDRVKIQLINNMGGNHDLAIPELDVGSKIISRQGAKTSFTFVANRAGTFPYYCTVPGHRSAGMEGKLVVSP